jgi:hypothetical protein
MSPVRVPRLRAEFVLDDRGRPQWDDKDNGYWIRLSVNDAPEDTFAVTYELHESYYDPIRVSRKPATFSTDISSYGDFTVRAEVRRKSRTDQIAVLLSRALRVAHGTIASKAITDAIADIAAH